LNKHLDIPQIRQLITDNKLKEVFGLLNAAAVATSDSASQNKITLLEARWKKLKSDQLKDILSEENKRLERNRINDDLLALLEVEAQPKTTTTTVPTKNVPAEKVLLKKTSWKTILPIVATTIGVLAGIAEITGYSVRDWWEQQPPVPTTIKDTVDTKSSKDTTTIPPVPPKQAPVERELKSNKPASTPQKSEPTTTTSSPTPIPKTEVPSVTQDALPPPKEKLQVQLKTQNGLDNLVFKEAEEVRLFFKVNRPCQLRTIYRLASGELILLDNDRSVNTPETQRWVELGDAFEVSAPFGAEELYIFAQEKPFPKLLTKEIDGYTIIEEGLPIALSKTRGLKKKLVFAESKLLITTQKK